MTEVDFADWQPIATAPRDGTRILVALRASEQGPAEVDVARWAKPEPSGDACWIATELGPRRDGRLQRCGTLFLDAPADRLAQASRVATGGTEGSA